MADQNVPEQTKRYGHADALEDLRRTAKAASIVRAVSLAVAAQADGIVSYGHESVSRWWVSIDAATWSIQEVRDSLSNKAEPPNTVDWVTSMSLIEAMGAALLQMDVGPDKKAMSAAQVKDLCEAVLDALSTLHDDLSAAASSLTQSPEQGS